MIRDSFGEFWIPATACLATVVARHSFFFLEYAKDLRIIVIKKKKSLTIHMTRF